MERDELSLLGKLEGHWGIASPRRCREPEATSAAHAGVEVGPLVPADKLQQGKREDASQLAPDVDGEQARVVSVPAGHYAGGSLLAA